MGENPRAIDGEAGKGGLAFDPEVEADVRTGEGEAAKFDGAVTTPAGLEAALDGVFRGPGTEATEPVGGDDEGYVWLLSGVGLNHRGAEHTEEEQWSFGEQEF